MNSHIIEILCSSRHLRSIPVLSKFEHLYNRQSELDFHPSGVGKINTSVCWELTCDKLVSRPGGVKESHSLNTTETGDEIEASIVH